MTDFRTGYLYSLAPIHCGGEGDLGNILDIAREVHTGFPYIPGSSLRGNLRNIVDQSDHAAADRLFGKELTIGDQMGVHQVWFGDARLLWVPMRTMSKDNQDIFVWVSCPTLLLNHALITRQEAVSFPEEAVGDRPGRYVIADAGLEVQQATDAQKNVMNLAKWPSHLESRIQSVWKKRRIVLPDSVFQILMEHSLWTQVRNKIQSGENGANREGSAEIFWTDICIPRDTIFYFTWGYQALKNNLIGSQDCQRLSTVLSGLVQVGGQGNVGRGWAQSWVTNDKLPSFLV